MYSDDSPKIDKKQKQNSSRSHTIFRMVIESRSRTGRGRSVMSTLSLVDLAGSESVRLANTHGQRQIEGGFINKSLLTLGKVVSMLTEEGKVQYTIVRVFFGPMLSLA